MFTAQLPAHFRPGFHRGVDVHLGSHLIVRSYSCSHDGANTNKIDSTASYILPNGGLAGMVWMYLVTLFGFSFAILSMAEMASM
jgi:hypothetical protein